MLYKLLIKRIMDFLLSFTSLIILAPVLITIAFVIIVFDRMNPLFIQPRPSIKGRIFKLIKFRTMNENIEVSKESERITALGRILRNYSLDELPQLINVLMGDMSLVGPRPLRIEYVELYNDFQIRRHDVKAGLTGWAQVNGRNSISWQEKFELDVWYVDNMSFFLDLKIILITIAKVLKRKGVNSTSEITMEPFKGN